MHDAIAVAHPNNLGDGARHGGGGALAVVSPGDNPVEELSPFAELHDEVDVLVVLVSRLQLHDVGVLRQRGHDGDLAPHVVDVHGSPELPLRDRLAGKGFLGLPVRAEVGDSELAPAQFPAQYVLVAYARPVAHWNHVLQDPDRSRRRPGRFVREWFRLFLPSAVRFIRLLVPVVIAIFYHVSFRAHVAVSHSEVSRASTSVSFSFSLKCLGFIVW